MLIQPGLLLRWQKTSRVHFLQMDFVSPELGGGLFYTVIRTQVIWTIQNACGQSLEQRQFNMSHLNISKAFHWPSMILDQLCASNTTACHWYMRCHQPWRGVSKLEPFVPCHAHPPIHLRLLASCLLLHLPPHFFGQNCWLYFYFFFGVTASPPPLRQEWVIHWHLWQICQTSPA